MEIYFSCIIITLFDNEAKPKCVQCYFETALVRFLNGEESLASQSAKFGLNEPRIERIPSSEIGEVLRVNCCRARETEREGTADAECLATSTVFPQL